MVVLVTGIKSGEEKQDIMDVVVNTDKVMVSPSVVGRNCVNVKLFHN